MSKQMRKLSSGAGWMARIGRLPVLAAAALTLTAPAAFAQGAPSAAASEPSQAQIAAARQVIEALGIEKTLSGIPGQHFDNIVTSLSATRPDLVRDLTGLRETLVKEFSKRTGEIVVKAERQYALRFSTDELKQIAAFFKSPAGVRYLGEAPSILNDVFVEAQGWTNTISTDMMTRVREEMKKKGHEL